MGERREPLLGRRRLPALVLTTLLALGIGASPATVQTALAAGPLRLAADATYTLDPGDGRVRVAVRFRATNLKPSTPSIIYFYRDIAFAIQPEARAIRASDSNGALSITTDQHRFHVEAEVHLRANLLFGQTTTFTIRYDLVGGSPRSDSPIRVGRAFATFGVWAWGDPGLSTVEVRTPKGFGSEVQGSPMHIERAASGQTLTASPADPIAFYAIVSSENEAAYRTTRVSVEGGIEIVVRAWPEDDAWDDTVSETLRLAMPELLERIGLDWPVEHDLNVRERYTPALEGYAGVFFTDEQRIDISEDLDPFIIVHEASHTWFNQDLFADRWIYEGLADEYAWRVLTAVNGDADVSPERPDIDDPGYVHLATWSFPRVIRDQETDDREQYGYRAAFWVMHGIFEEAGVEGLRAAFAAADANRTAYPGAGTPEIVAGADSWRRFLDLVEPLEEPDSSSIDQLLRDYVLLDDDARDLDERRVAREAYRELIDTGDGWLPPWYVRRPMGEWRFDLATARIAEAEGVLELEDRVADAAGALDLEADDALRTAYEGTTEGFDGAAGIGQRQLAALAALGEARTAVDAQPDLLTQVGLIGETARLPYDAARDAFERGELDSAMASAAAAKAIITGAAATGQARLLIAVGVTVLVLVLLLLLGVALRRRRRRALLLGAAGAGTAGASTAGASTAGADAVGAGAVGPGASGVAESEAGAIWPPSDPAATGSTAAGPGPIWSASDPVKAVPYATLAADPAAALPPSSESPPDLEGGHARGDLPAGR